MHSLMQEEVAERKEGGRPLPPFMCGFWGCVPVYRGGCLLGARRESAYDRAYVEEQAEAAKPAGLVGAVEKMSQLTSALPPVGPRTQPNIGLLPQPIP